MTVFVDDMYKVPMGRFGRMKMSHMIATLEDELHEMAKLIGVARKWYQGDHYDIAQSKRREAIALGAVEVTMRNLAGMMYLKRCGFTDWYVDPHKAMERMIQDKFPERKPKQGVLDL